MSGEKLDLKGGHCYKFETKEGEAAIYRWAKEKQYTPLVFTRGRPSDVENEYGVGKENLISLSSKGMKGIKNIQPNDVSKLSAEIAGLKEKSWAHFGKGTISYLCSQNDFAQVLRTLQYIGEIVSDNDECVLTAHINPKSFDEKELSRVYDTVPLLPLKWATEEKKE